MPHFYVASRSRYVVVEAADDAEALRRALPNLERLYVEVSERIGRDTSAQIHVVRPATDGEIEMEWRRGMSPGS
jgi:hypothetical protein